MLIENNIQPKGHSCLFYKVHKNVEKYDYIQHSTLLYGTPNNQRFPQEMLIEVFSPTLALFLTTVGMTMLNLA